MIIKIKPFDTLFFRDGKPFSMGEEVWASGIFPPPPSVLYGALRTAYFANYPQTLPKAQTDEDPTKELRINFIGLAIGNQTYLPLGKDLVREKNNPYDQHLLSLESVSAIGSSPFFKPDQPSGTVLKASTASPIESHDAGTMIRVRDLQKYLNPTKLSGRNLFGLKSPQDYLSKDPKTGIGRSRKTGSAEDGKLYRVEMVRMATKMQSDISIVVDFEGLDLPKEGLIKLGGEAKGCTYQQIEAPSIYPPAPESFSSTFRIYFATPAIFKKGWKPTAISPESPLEVSLNGVQLRLVGASIDKPSYQGGFDIKNREFKPMKRLLAAGSVFFCEFIDPNQDISEAISKLHGQCLSEEKIHEGYGLAFLGSTLQTT